MTWSCYDAPMVTLKWLLVVVVFGYGGLCFMLMLTQRSLMYFPERVRTAPSAAGFDAPATPSAGTKVRRKTWKWPIGRGRRSGGNYLPTTPSPRRC